MLPSQLWRDTALLYEEPLRSRFATEIRITVETSLKTAAKFPPFMASEKKKPRTGLLHCKKKRRVVESTVQQLDRPLDISKWILGCCSIGGFLWAGFLLGQGFSCSAAVFAFLAAPLPLGGSLCCFFKKKTARDRTTLRPEKK